MMGRQLRDYSGYDGIKNQSGILLYCNNASWMEFCGRRISNSEYTVHLAFHEKQLHSLSKLKFYKVSHRLVVLTVQPLSTHMPGCFPSILLPSSSLYLAHLLLQLLLRPYLICSAALLLAAVFGTRR